MLHDDMIIGSTLILPTPKFGVSMVGMTTAAAARVDEGGLLACHKTKSRLISLSTPQVEQHHRSRRQWQRPREWCHSADASKGSNSRRAYCGEQAKNGHILTPEMLNACNSRSLRRLVSNDSRVNINTTACSTSSLNAGIRMFRSDQSSTYFTTGTGRVIPTNTWTMHQAQQHRRPQRQQQHFLDVHQQNDKSNPILAWSHSPSNPTTTLKYNALMATSVSPALVDESFGNNPKTSKSRRQFEFPTNDRTPDLPLFPTVIGHCHQGRRRHMVSSTDYVKPPSDLSSAPCRTSYQYVRGDDAIAAIPSNRGKIEEETSSLSPIVQSKAPDPPSTPYHELKMSSTAVMAKQVQARSHGFPMTSLRRSASLPTTRTDFVPQKDIPLNQHDHDRSNDRGVSMKSSSCSTLNSSTLKGRHSLPITSKSEDNQSLFNKSLNDIEMSSGRTVMMSDDTSVSFSRSHHGQEDFHEHCHQYQVGEILRDESHSIAFTSCTQALILLSKLPLNSPIFVKRTSREWTYATLVSCIAQQHQSSDNDEELCYSLVASLHSTRNVKKILKMDRWEKCLRLVNAKVVAIDVLACTTAAAAVSPTSVAAVTHLPVEATSPSTATMNSGATNPNSMCITVSDLYSTANTVASSMSSADIIAGNPFVVHFPTVGAHDPEPKNSSDRSLTMTASLNNLHSKKVSWGFTLSSDDDVSSKSEATLLRSGSKVSSTPDSDNTVSHTSSDSPNTVNLYARHFWGSRRDRMRPRGTHRNKPSSRRGCVSRSNEKDGAQRMWCDSTCAPESGSFSDASGGSSWNILLDKNSGTEHDTIPTLPYYFHTALHS